MDTIVDAALRLTEGRGLDAWSLRDLSRELGISQAALHRHVQGKDALHRQIAERIAGMIERPDPDLPWDDWFRALLFPVRALLLRYPGVAKWMLMHGPTSPSFTLIVGDGIAALRRAEFGERTVVTYASIVNTAMLAIAMSDDGHAGEDEAPREQAAMMAEFAQLRSQSPGVQLVTRELIAPAGGSSADRNSADPNSAARTGEERYRFVVETMLTDLTATALSTAADRP